jgi:alpha-glucosidase
MHNSWRDINTLYHIYPRSFQDTNDDGIGDLPGITSRLDYLSLVLGVDAIWLSPFFTSPMRDFGYDVANYRQVDSDYGTLDDFKKLLDEAHRRHMKVMIDFVPCHTSDQHAWFKESRSSRDNPKRDYYTWRDPGPDGGAPNNWLSQSGGTSWTFDETTGQYYLHSFLSAQPDLNWDNPSLRKEMTDTVRWWFEQGVDGMRVDAIWGISKDPNLADDPQNPEFHGEHPSEYGHFIHNKCKYGPNFTNYLKELSDVCHEFENRQMIFEFYPDDKIGDFYDQYHQVAAEVNPDVASTFFMELIRSPWHADMLGNGLDRYINYAAKDALPVFCLGNHDQPRIVSRIGESKARAMALLNLTLPGLSVIYYGDEIGMENGELTPSQVRDTFSPLNTSDTTRDLERTPMQWDHSARTSFSQVTPWLPIHKNHRTINAMTELSDSSSMLSLYRRLVRLRKQYPVLRIGSFTRLFVGSGYVLAFKRELDDQRVYVVVNFADQPQDIQLPEICSYLVSSQTAPRERESREAKPTLRPLEAALYIA